MQAAIYERYGSPGEIKIGEKEIPVPKEHEVLVRVSATTVNRTDCAMLRGKPFIMRMSTGLLQPGNTTTGTDFAGIVEAAGRRVSAFSIGDRVFGFDDGGLGSHAQYITISERNAIEKMPSDMQFIDAVACTEGAHYALNFVNKVKIKAGDKVLVNGATGAIGSAVVQLAKYYGANITAVCELEYADLVKSIGASYLIDFTQERFSASGEKYHFIFDAVGKSDFKSCRPLLKAGGVYISSELGTWAQNPLFALSTSVIGNKKVIFPWPADRLGSLRFIKKLWEEGCFSAVIDRTFPFQEIADAFRYVEKGRKIGNVILVVSDKESD